MQGREDGYAQGHQQGHRDAGDAAELGARAFIALTAADAASKAHTADTATSLDVPRFRQRPTVVPTIRPKPTLAQFLDGLRKGGVLSDRKEEAA